MDGQFSKFGAVGNFSRLDEHIFFDEWYTAEATIRAGFGEVQLRKNYGESFQRGIFGAGYAHVKHRKCRRAEAGALVSSSQLLLFSGQLLVGSRQLAIEGLLFSWKTENDN